MNPQSFVHLPRKASAGPVGFVLGSAEVVVTDGRGFYAVPTAKAYQCLWHLDLAGVTAPAGTAKHREQVLDVVQALMAEAGA